MPSRTWFFSRKSRNRSQHAANGNGGGGKGGKGGKGFSKGSIQPEDPEVAYQSAIREAMRLAARQRLQPQLVAEEWSVPTVTAQDLNHRGGVALCYKADLPETLRRVGYTLEPCAVLLTQDPVQLGLKGYKFESVQFTVRVRDDDGRLKPVSLERFLVQLGFGDAVRQTATGDIIVQLPTCMHKFVAKFPSLHGWQPEMITGTTVSKLLEKHLPQGSFTEILPRVNEKTLTATFRGHSDLIDTILKMSGQDAVFYKLHESERCRPELELLWLPDGTSLQDAMEHTTSKDIQGVAMKNAAYSPRYALRFNTPDDLKKYAQEHGIEDYSHLGRWKLHGVPSHSGPIGVYTVLQQRNWNVHEVLYCNSKHSVFVAQEKGDDSPICIEVGSHKKQLRFEAVNAVARTQQSQAAQASRSKPSAVPKPKNQADAFWKKAAAECVVRQAPPKRPADGPTGETPEKGKPRQT